MNTNMHKVRIKIIILVSYIINKIQNMIVLFINAHKNDEQGKTKFQRYYTYIKKILNQTIYYGTHFEEQIRNKDQLIDYLYDPLQFNHSGKAQEKFKSVTYVFVDGSLNVPPWAHSMKNLYLFIRNCLKQNKKVHLNGFGHLAAYYYLSTGFSKDYLIGKMKNVETHTGKQDYLYQQDTGDLYLGGKKVCNSGILINKQSRPFSSKSTQALKKGVVLPTKFHYLAFDAKNSNKLLQNIRFPFSIYEKSKVFCTPKLLSKAKVHILIQTEGKAPLAFTYENSLSTHLLCPEMLKLIINWIRQTNQIKINKRVEEQFNDFAQVGFDNNLQQHKTISYLKMNSLIKNSPGNRSPKVNSSLKKSKYEFEKPSLRCSGPYFSEYEQSTMQISSNKNKNLGRSRFIFKSELEKSEIKNYVQRTPSRPPSAHNFRQINKSKWIDKKTFFVT